MLLSQMIDKLNEDLSREYAHMNFYLHSAAMVKGLHREEYSEFFLEEAKSEMDHVLQFKKLIIGLGGYPTTTCWPFNTTHTNLVTIIQYALYLEEEVVKNYVQRMDEAAELEASDKVNGRYIGLFLEEQMLDSRKAVDHYRQILGA